MAGPRRGRFGIFGKPRVFSRRADELAQRIDQRADLLGREADDAAIGGGQAKRGKAARCRILVLREGGKDVAEETIADLVRRVRNIVAGERALLEEGEAFLVVDVVGARDIVALVDQDLLGDQFVDQLGDERLHVDELRGAMLLEKLAHLLDEGIGNLFAPEKAGRNRKMMRDPQDQGADVALNLGHCGPGRISATNFSNR